MVQYDSPRLVSQAVDAGLLRAICALSRILDDLEQSKPSHDDVKQLKLSLRFILGDILPKSMMYRSVIKVMKDEHKEIDPDVPDKTIMRSYLREEWMSLVLLLYLRSTIAKFPKQIRGKGNVSCDCVTARVSPILLLENSPNSSARKEGRNPSCCGALDASTSTIAQRHAKRKLGRYIVTCAS
jgi:hypothetical protein